MVESFSQVCERISTILFFYTKPGKTFDCFLNYMNVILILKVIEGKEKNNVMLF